MARETHGGVSEQAKASHHRWLDAVVLKNNTRYRGAMYLAGYSIECLLKTKIMRRFGCLNLKELQDELRRRGMLAENSSIYTHQIEELADFADVTNRLRADPGLYRKFNVVNRWIPAWRYSPDRGDDEVDLFFECAEVIRHWIEVNS